MSQQIDPSPAAPSAAAGRRPRIDWRRYRKLRRFVLRTFLQAFWHDLVLNRRSLSWARSAPLPRWRRVARRYRTLAVEMGGVLIKIGQFLSIRVDLLPPEITRELAGLQDEVPPAPLAGVLERIAEDFGRPADEVFAGFEAEPLGAASLAQVHRARRHDGETVVVKVLRPGIEVLVETDLAAVDLAARGLKLWKKLRRRVDFDLLTEEIATTTRAELDMEAEADNAERFAEIFAGDPRVRIPRVFRGESSRHVLTLENVGFLKIGDPEAFEAAGIDRREVARVVYRVYMEQIFVHHFVHADPHPGNLFVRPLREPGEAAGPGFAPGEAPPARAGRRFELVFVDFGMVAAIPPRLRAALRDYAIALGTRDAARMVRSYQAAGVLLPGADLQRIEEIHEDLFARFWGVSLGDMRDTAMSEAAYFIRQYRDLLFQLPFQVQVDLLFVSRAVGILSGLATSLDPKFDPWAETIPFARRLAAEELRRGPLEWLEELAGQARRAVQLPERLERALGRVERGELRLEATLDRDSRRRLAGAERAGRRLAWAVVGAALLISAALLQPGPATALTPWLGGAGVVVALRALWPW